MTLRKREKSTTIYLLRHAHSRANLSGVLAGRMEGVHLSERGVNESLSLVPVLTALNIDRVHVSPLTRCSETVAPFIKKQSKIKVFEDPSFIEMDYGDWTGSKLTLLSRKDLWRSIQENPSSVRFPHGESFLEMSARAIAGIEAINSDGRNHLVVSHGDVIRVLINHYLGSHLNNFQRLAVGPASLSTLQFTKKGPNIHGVNQSLTVSEPGNSSLGGGSGQR
jgi:probable phosphomutase (TIGR03848 family)